jgi:Uma2 family endonuclease
MSIPMTSDALDAGLEVGAPAAAIPRPPTGLIETDGEPLESDWHRLAMNLLIEIVCFFLRDRDDYFVGGNMFIYYGTRQSKNLDYRGPDFFFVWGRPLNPPRPYWAVWDEEGHYPNMIIELSSPTTAMIDRTTKKDIYEKKFRTPEYFIYDPATRKFEGWRLANDSYQPIQPNERGWLWCEQLGLWLGSCDSSYLRKDAHYLRFFTANGEMVPTLGEFEQQRADIERQRADAAEAELAKLKAQVSEAKKNGNE